MNGVEVLAHKLVTEIFGVKSLEFVGHGGALHKEHPAAHLQGIGDAGQGLFHQFEGSADDAIYRDCHAAAGDLVTKDVDSPEAHLLNDHVQEIDTVGPGFTKRKTNPQIHDFQRNSRKTGATPHVDHAGGPLGHVSVYKRAVGVMPLHHGLESV